MEIIQNSAILVSVISIIIFSYTFLNLYKFENDIHYYINLTSIICTFFTILFFINLFVIKTVKYIIISGLIFLILLVIFNLKKFKINNNSKNFIIGLITLICLIILISSIFYYYKYYYNMIFNWDDFSHWMRIYKLYSINGLNIDSIINFSINQSYLTKVFQNYPAIHSYASAILFPYPINESYKVYLLLTCFLVIIIYDIIRIFEISSEKFIALILYFGIIFSASTPLNHNNQVDILLPLLIGFAIINDKNQSLLISFLNINVILFSIFLKPPTAIALILIYISFKILIKEQTSRILKIYLIPIAIYFLYTFYLSNNTNNSDYNLIKNSTYLNFILNILLNFLKIILVEFINPFLNFNPSKSFTNLIGIIILIIYFKNINKIKHAYFLLFATIIYILYLSVSYNTFVLDSSERFASFDRYFLSLYLFFLVYSIKFLFSNNCIKNTQYIYFIIYINIANFFPKLIYLIPLFFISYYLFNKYILNKRELFKYLLASCLIPLFLIKQEYIFPTDPMVKNSEALQKMNKNLNDFIDIEVCNSNGYDYLAIDYYSDFIKRYKIINKNCDSIPKYKVINSNKL